MAKRPVLYPHDKKVHFKCPLTKKLTLCARKGKTKTINIHFGILEIKNVLPSTPQK